MKKDPVKDLFNHLKSLGYWKDYQSYEEYRRKHLGIVEKEDKKKEEFEKWKTSLPENEQGQFYELFGEE